MADGWARARPDDEILLSPARRRRRGHARGDRGGRRLEVADGRRPRPARAADRGALAAISDGRPHGRRRDGRGVGAVAGPTRTSATRSRRPASAPASCSGPRWTPASRTSRSGSAAARRRTAGRGLPRGARWTSGGRRPDALDASTSQVACDVSNPLLGPTGAAADLRPAEGRDARRRSRELDERNAALGRRARGARAGRPRARHAGRRRGRRRRLRPAGDPGPVSTRSPCAPASTSSWRRPTSTRSSRAPTSSSPARAGSMPRRRSARPRSASRKRAQAAGVPCIAVGGGVEPEGIEALAAVGAVAVPGRPSGRRRRGGDGRRHRPARTLRRAARSPRHRSAPHGGRDDPGPPPAPSAEAEAAAPKKRRFSDPARTLREAARALPARARAVRARRPGRPVRPPESGSAASTRRAS